MRLMWPPLREFICCQEAPGKKFLFLFCVFTFCWILFCYTSLKQTEVKTMTQQKAQDCEQKVLLSALKHSFCSVISECVTVGVCLQIKIRTNRSDLFYMRDVLLRWTLPKLVLTPNISSLKLFGQEPAHLSIPSSRKQLSLLKYTKLCGLLTAETSCNKSFQKSFSSEKPTEHIEIFTCWSFLYSVCKYLKNDRVICNIINMFEQLNMLFVFRVWRSRSIASVWSWTSFTPLITSRTWWRWWAWSTCSGWDKKTWGRGSDWDRSSLVLTSIHPWLQFWQH